MSGEYRYFPRKPTAAEIERAAGKLEQATVAELLRYWRTLDRPELRSDEFRDGLAILVGLFALSYRGEHARP